MHRDRYVNFIIEFLNFVLILVRVRNRKFIIFCFWSPYFCYCWALENLDLLLFQLFLINIDKSVIPSFKIESRLIVVSSSYFTILEKQKLFLKFNQSLIHFNEISLHYQFLYLSTLEVDQVHSDIKMVCFLS